jgi:hypothetical protein
MRREKTRLKASRVCRALHNGNPARGARYSRVAGRRGGNAVILRVSRLSPGGAEALRGRHSPIAWANTTLGDGDAAAASGSAVIDSRKLFSGTEPMSFASRESAS